jgi:hypothetical protein
MLSAALPQAQAAQVKSIKPTGALELENGQIAQFAGLIIPQESFSILSVLVSGKDLEFERESSEDYPKDAPSESGYFYVQTFEMDFPFKPNDPPRETKVMVNQLLISMGLARVDAEKNFKHREKFLKIEAEARSRGMGIWSYEAIPPQLP